MTDTDWTGWYIEWLVTGQPSSVPSLSPATLNCRRSIRQHSEEYWISTGEKKMGNPSSCGIKENICFNCCSALVLIVLMIYVRGGELKCYFITCFNLLATVDALVGYKFRKINKKINMGKLLKVLPIFALHSVSM